MEIPLSSRTASITNDDLAENSSAMTKDNFSLIEPNTGDGDLDNQGKESEYAGSVVGDFDEDEEQVGIPIKARTVNNVHGKRASNSLNKKKPTRKRRVTANLSATKYDVGK